MKEAGEYGRREIEQDTREERNGDPEVIGTVVYYAARTYLRPGSCY